jgi:glycolate oxidase iron-sulfur subunit
MQTNFSLTQLLDADNRSSEQVLRACVHCGFCTATCPTYLLLGDELDSPRGRIYLIKDMLENERAPSPQVVTHVDRCLSCLSCMTTCPSGVNYMHLVDHARAYIEENYRRPLFEKLLRSFLGLVLPRPRLFRLALMAGLVARPFRAFFTGRIAAMLRMAPAHLPRASSVDMPQTFPARGDRQRRVALLNGCAQKVVAPHINEATIRLLTRHGCEVVVAQGAGCCGALTHHMGQEKSAHGFARANIDAWSAEIDAGGLDAIVINTSGCGTTIKDYGFMFREDTAYAEKAARISTLAKDITELMNEIGLKRGATLDAPLAPLTIAYHAACSLQHGQQIRVEPKHLLTQAGFIVKDVPEGHICCGSAGTYNLLQPEIAEQLKARKLGNIAKLNADVVATGNVGCMMQIASGSGIPVLHTAELLDWASGGPKPAALS